MVGQFRESVFGRLGGYDDVNDADRLGRDPAMRWIVGGHAIKGRAASTSQMGRFETEVLATEENLAALGDLSGQWIDRVPDRRPPKMIILDMPSDGCKGDTVPSAVERWYDFPEFGCHLGNVGFSPWNRT